MGRFIDADPEQSLTHATNKFIKRFEKLERLAKENGNELDTLTLEQMDMLWNEIKKSE